MKILCVIDSLGSGGAQRQLVLLAKGFQERGHDVSFLVYHDIAFFEDELIKVGITVNKVLESNYLRRLLKMRKIIRNGDYDSVLSFLEAPNFICEISSLPYRRWKLIVGERNASPSIFKSIKARSFRYFHFFADFVVANSHQNVRMVRDVNPFLSKKKCKVLYNMVDFIKWQPTSINSSSEKFNLTIVARHQYQKNLIGLVEAVSLLSPKERERLRVNWFGDERNDNSKIEGVKRIKELGLQKIFSFHSATKDIKSKMEEADVIGLFSFYEGLPNCICEAMSLGKPVITTSFSDMREIIKNGENGFIIESPAPLSIKQGIQQILLASKSELEQVGCNGRRLALSLFCDATDKYLALMQKSKK